MRPTLLVPFLLGACASLPHIPPQSRTVEEQVDAAVVVEVECGGGDAWAHAGMASGVLISGRHVLTAYHVTACPELPTVHVMLADGHWFRMVVDREDATDDLSRLEVFSAGAMLPRVVPPQLADAIMAAPVCTSPAWPSKMTGDCGVVEQRGLAALRTEPGNSGAGVYDLAGRLVGIVSMGSVTHVRFSSVDESWLSGT